MAFHDCGPLDSGGLPPGQFRGSRDSASCCSTAHRRSKRTYALQPGQACFFFKEKRIKVLELVPRYSLFHRIVPIGNDIFMFVLIRFER